MHDNYVTKAANVHVVLDDFLTALDGSITVLGDIFYSIALVTLLTYSCCCSYSIAQYSEYTVVQMTLL